MVSGKAASVECPACEANFERSQSVPGESGSLQCPHCKFEFDLESELPQEEAHEAPHRKPHAAPPLPTPRCLDDDRNGMENSRQFPPTTPPPTRPPPKTGTNAETENQVDEESDESDFESPLGQRDSDSNLFDEPLVNDASKTRAAFRTDDESFQLEKPTPVTQTRENDSGDQENKTLSRNLILGIVLSLVCLVSMFGIIYMLVTPPKKVVSKDNGEPGDSTTVQDQTDSDPESTSRDDVSKDIENKTNVGVAASINAKIYDQIWSNNAKYISQLNLADAEVDSMGGTIIDRRGWMLTGVQQLHKSSLVKGNQLTGKSWKERRFKDLPEFERVEAIVPEYNLCVLEFSSDQAPKSEIVIDTSFNFEAATFMYAINTHSINANERFVRCKVIGQAIHEDEKPELKTKMESIGLNVEPNHRWTKYNCELSSRDAPCALFSPESELVAIHLFQDETTGIGYGIPAKFISSLKSGALGDPTEIEDSVVVQDLQKRFSGGDDYEIKLIQIADAAEVALGDFKIIERLREQFMFCDSDLDWYPKSMAEYQQLQQFVGLLFAADEIRMNKELSQQRRSIFEEEADGLCEKISTIQWPTAREITQQNKFANRVLEVPGQPFFAYVVVDHPGAVSPTINGQPTTVFKVIGSDQKIVVPLTKRHGELDLGTEWLLLGQDDPTGKTIQYMSEKAEFARLIHSFRLLAPPK